MIKILKNRITKKQLRNENERMRKTISAKNKTIEELTNECENIKKEFEEQIQKLKVEISTTELLLEDEKKQRNISKTIKKQLEDKIRELNGTKGGLTKENNKLKKENIDLKKQLEESMSNKYLVKKIPSGRFPRGEKIKLKKATHNSQVQKILNEKTASDD